MSSTNRSKSSKESRAINKDYYVTPVDEIENFLTEFLRHEPTALNGVILDPCAGGDLFHPMSYPTALKKFGAKDIRTIDIRQDSLARIVGNYLTCYFNGQDTPYLIITNPPFNIAQSIIEKAMQDVESSGFVVMLLRLNYLGSKGRMEFWKKHKPKYVFVHPIRMSFTDDGNTDSIEYAHFVWQKGFTGDTKMFILGVA